MKTLAGFLVTLLVTSLSYADTVYVRKSTAENGVTATEAENVRESLRKAITAQGSKIAPTPGQAQWTLRAVVSKAATGAYAVKVERVHGGKLVGTSHGSDMNLDEATRLATTNLVQSMGSDLPEKTSMTNSGTLSPSDSRDVAANPQESLSAVEAKHPNFVKNWVVAIGPVISNALVGTNGTKFGISVAYNMGLAEHFNLRFVSENNFNTGSLGGTAVQTVGVGGLYYLNDRLSDFTPYLQLDLAFGGANRGNDATEWGGGAIGVEFFRTQSATFLVYLREMVAYTQNGSTPANFPNITQFMVGINF